MSILKRPQSHEGEEIGAMRPDTRDTGQTIDNERMFTSHHLNFPGPTEQSVTGRGDGMEMYSGSSPLMGSGIFQYLCKLFLQFLSQTWIQTCFRYAKYSFNDIPPRFQERKPERAKCGLRGQLNNIPFDSSLVINGRRPSVMGIEKSNGMMVVISN